MISEYKEHLSRQGFELKDQIGSGLSGRTYKGFQHSLNRPVAIKFFDSEFNKNNNDLKKRFRRESQLLAELQHPSIPYVLTTGTINFEKDNIPYIVMQYIPGITLDEYIKKHSPVSLDTAINISLQVLDALSFVHEKGIVHRDIKPSNIMMLPSGHCFVIDFSIGFKINPKAGMTRATRTGDHLGSVIYMSPEQKLNIKDVNQRTDVYSYSLVLCEMLTSKPELQSISASNFRFPSTLIKVIEKGCRYEATGRYSNAGEYLRELKEISSKSLPFLDTPSKAVCTNTKCSSANWSPRGYYRGPYFIDESTQPFCTSCGSTLLYQCEECGAPINNTKFCGGCGTQQFTVPECLQCGSYLMKTDMGKDTKADGCEKCRSQKLNAQNNSTTINDSFDDDIPF